MAKVIKSFIDKDSGKVFMTGTEYNGSRVDELGEKGYLVSNKVAEAPVETVRKEKPKPKSKKIAKAIEGR